MLTVKNIVTLLLLIFCFLSIFASAKNDTEIVKGELGKKLDLYLTRITPFGFSGALLVAKDGEIILNQGYGMAIRSKGIRNTSETVFCTGSITKQFTAAGIMKLEMQGKLNTNDPINKYLDGVPQDKSGITLHHLLTHTSGLVQDVGGDYEIANRDETVKKVLAQPLEFNAGERFEYTNVGYSLLAAIIEKISGKSYEEFLNEQLFKPAGMYFTGYRIPEWDKKVVAHWYVGDTDNGIPLEKPFPYWNLLGNGGIISTTEDMYKWHLALLGEKVLSAEAKKKLFTPFLNDYAYGWDVLQTPHGILIQHNGGSDLGNSAEIRRYIDSNVVTILFCNQFYNGKPLIDAVRDKIENLVFGGDVEIPPAVMASKPDILRRFEGKYKLPSGGILTACAGNNGLVIRAEGQEAINALAFPEQENLSLYNDLNARSVTIFESAIKGDFKPLGEMLANKEKRFERVRQFIQMRMERNKENTGEIKNVGVLGTLPSSFEDGAVETIVELKGEKGSVLFLLVWKDGKNLGVGPVESEQVISMPFLPISETEFTGYHLGMAKNVSISFNISDGDSVLSLVLHKKSGKLEAVKVKKQVR